MTFEAFLKKHSKITRSLKKFILDYEPQLDAETFSAFLVSLSEELEKASAEFLALPVGAERAYKLHQLVEEEIALGANIEVSCFKGCSACCHMEVEITAYEADILKDIVEGGHVIDSARLRKQSEREVQDPLWRQGRRGENNRCVFLNGEGACSIYEKRPVMCRRHSVKSPAKNCETLDATIVLRYFPKVDLLISAANEDPSLTIGPLAKMLQVRF
jgi:Fe-S-cluster containining protein